MEMPIEPLMLLLVLYCSAVLWAASRLSLLSALRVTLLPAVTLLPWMVISPSPRPSHEGRGRSAGRDVDVIARRHRRALRRAAALRGLARALRSADADAQIHAAGLVGGMVIGVCGNMLGLTQKFS